LADNAAKAWSLKWLLSAIVTALTHAANAGDLETAKLANLYQSDKFLSTLNIPSFTLSTAQVTLHFVFLGPNPDDSDDIMIRADLGTLKPMDSDKLTELTVTFADRPIGVPPST